MFRASKQTVGHINAVRSYYANGKQHMRQDKKEAYKELT